MKKKKIIILYIIFTQSGKYHTGRVEWTTKKKKKITPHLPFSSKHSSDGCLRPVSDETLLEFRVKTCKK